MSQHFDKVYLMQQSRDGAQRLIRPSYNQGTTNFIADNKSCVSKSTIFGNSDSVTYFFKPKLSKEKVSIEIQRNKTVVSKRSGSS